MPLPKLRLEIPQEGYALVDGEAVLRAKVGAGPSRQRLDMLGAPAEIDMTLVLGGGEYQYWRAFYRSTLVEGALPFLVDLVIDTATPQECTAKIIPGTHRLSGVNGDAHMVQMRLEVVMPDPPVDDAAIIMLYEQYGDAAPFLLDQLATLVNVDFPGALL